MKKGVFSGCWSQNDERPSSGWMHASKIGGVCLSIIFNNLLEMLTDGLEMFNYGYVIFNEFLGAQCMWFGCIQLKEEDVTKFLAFNCYTALLLLLLLNIVIVEHCCCYFWTLLLLLLLHIVVQHYCYCCWTLLLLLFNIVAVIVVDIVGVIVIGHCCCHCCWTLLLLSLKRSVTDGEYLYMYCNIKYSGIVTNYSLC